MVGMLVLVIVGSFVTGLWTTLFVRGLVPKDIKVGVVTMILCVVATGWAASKIYPYLPKTATTQTSDR